MPERNCPHCGAVIPRSATWCASCCKRMPTVFENCPTHGEYTRKYGATALCSACQEPVPLSEWLPGLFILIFGPPLKLFLAVAGTFFVIVNGWSIIWPCLLIFAAFCLLWGPMKLAGSIALVIWLLAAIGKMVML